MQGFALLSGFIEQARMHAVAQHTYVWVVFSQNQSKGMSVMALASTTGLDPIQGRAGTYSIPSQRFKLCHRS